MPGPRETLRDAPGELRFVDGQDHPEASAVSEANVG